MGTPAALVLVAAGLLALAVGPAGGAGAVEPPGGDDQIPADLYIHDDAVIFGKALHSFESDGQLVNVVLGDFSFVVGKRSVSGRDAVIWIKERRLGVQTLRDIQIYVEGDAKAVEPDGATTTDQVMLVTLHQQGLLRARVNQAGQTPLEQLPIYAKALERRRQAATQSVVRMPVMLVQATKPPAKDKQPKPTTTQASQPTTRPKPPIYQPLTFYAEQVSTQEISDPANPESRLRVTVGRGSVYVSVGNPEEERFMEMSAQGAVVYSLPGQGQDAPTTRALGVYLEGDVIMRRGERTISGTRLFYDFQTGKALILEPVLRTIQEQREIPIYIRGKQGRQLEAQETPSGMKIQGREWLFTDAYVTTSDFYTPTYAIHGRRVLLRDLTPYDDEGRSVGPMSARTELRNTTFDIAGIPVLWWPYATFEGEQGHTALRHVEVHHSGDFGWGVSSEWQLFGLLGVAPPEGVDGKLELDGWEKGFFIAPRLEYFKENYGGFLWGTFLRDNSREDNFGLRRRIKDVPTDRGRVLFRHKQFLPQDWELQLELSYLSDKNFLEKYYPGEFWTTKEQETDIYAKKQRDNWAFTSLVQARINDFLTQTESYPDLAGYIVGQSLWQDRLTWYAQAHAGLLRFRPAMDSGVQSSPPTGRADTRQEIDAPLALGPFKLLPFAVGRLTCWSETPEGDGQARPWGQIGLSATTNIWRLYDGAESRLWDIHKLKHVITPYGAVFFSDTDVQPSELYPFTPELEQYTRRLGGGAIGVQNLFQTKRGPPEAAQIVDWLRFNVYGAFFDDPTTLPADGRYFWYRPEFSLPRNSINGELAWFFADSTSLLADMNYDTDTRDIGRADVGIAIERDPRLKYYIGNRYIRDVNSNVGTFGLVYLLTEKYRLRVFEQYDYQFEGGRNQVTSVSLTRKFPRFYVSVSFSYSRAQDDVGVALSIWPEGIPEVRIGGPRMSLTNAFGPAER